jgi:hypothetical protein
LALSFCLFSLPNAKAEHADKFEAPGFCSFVNSVDQISPDGASNFSDLLKQFRSRPSIVSDVATPQPNLSLVYQSTSKRTWKFDYQLQRPTGHRIVRASIPTILIRNHTSAQFHIKAATVSRTIRVRSKRKQITPMLPWAYRSMSEITTRMMWIGSEFRSMMRSCISPAEQLSTRVAKVLKNCMKMMN